MRKRCESGASCRVSYNHGFESNKSIHTHTLITGNYASFNYLIYGEF
jgi:hypothetical protein